MGIANYLTIGRLFIPPIFLMMYLKYEFLGISFHVLPYILLFLMAILEISDALDGYLARKYNQVTDFGKLMDPMADSIARISVFLSFTDGFLQLPMILIFAFLYRDSAVWTLRALCALRGFALAARPSGKIKAIIQGVTAIAIIIMMIPYSLNMITLETLRSVSTTMVSIAAVYTIFSAVDYFYAYRNYIRKILAPRKKGPHA